MPCSGPRYLPRRISRSASSACFSASSSVSVTTQSSAGPYFFNRARYIFVNSTGETCFVRTSSASCVTEQKASSSTDLNFGGSTLLALIFRSEEHTSELQSLRHLVCRLLLEKK